MVVFSLSSLLLREKCQPPDDAQNRSDIVARAAILVVKSLNGEHACP